MKKKQIKALKKSIKQWKIIYELLYHDVYDNFMSAKIQSLKRMGESGTLFKLCFLCHEFHDSINKTCDGCPMEGHWPNKNKNKPPVKQCFHPESLYDDIELRLSVKPKKVKRILRAMKKRLKELENE